jgi:hypothetical protein
MERINERNMIEYIKEADAIIQANPRILEDEPYPDIKRAYRDHYRRKRGNQSSVTRKSCYEKELERLQAERDYKWEKANEPIWYGNYTSCDDELDAVGGEENALWNID